MRSLAEIAERLVVCNRGVYILIYGYATRERNSRVVDHVVYARVSDVFEVAVPDSSVGSCGALMVVLAVMRGGDG